MILNEKALEAAGHEPHCALREHAGADTFCTCETRLNIEAYLEAMAEILGALPFEKCPTCGTPKMDDATKMLVLYFKTEADRAEFVEVSKGIHPNARAVPV